MPATEAVQRRWVRKLSAAGTSSVLSMRRSSTFGWPTRTMGAPAWVANSPSIAASVAG